MNVIYLSTLNPKNDISLNHKNDSPLNPKNDNTNSSSNPKNDNTNSSSNHNNDSPLKSKNDNTNPKNRKRPLSKIQQTIKDMTSGHKLTFVSDINSSNNTNNTNKYLYLTKPINYQSYTTESPSQITLNLQVIIFHIVNHSYINYFV